MLNQTNNNEIVKPKHIHYRIRLTLDIIDTEYIFTLAEASKSFTRFLNILEHYSNVNSIYNMFNEFLNTF